MKIKYITMKYLFILLLIACVSCKTVKDTPQASEKTKTEQNHIEGGITERVHDRIEIKAQIGRNEFNQNNGVQIIKSKLEGNILSMKIGYSGGCSKHEFKVIGNPMISKSLPPIRRVELVHISNGDSCREYIEQELRIDLSELAYTKELGSIIKLQFAKIEAPIMYTYSTN